ncbi:MAG: LON peptidase substrate-binding domain-containing protein [Rhodoferax sp.]|nr:LON peptidase substrate-binding domain-containing protein [Rhodoferax sp.]
MERIPLFPLSSGVFPDGVLQLQIFEVRYLDLIRRCYREKTPFGIAWLAQGNEVAVPRQVPRLHAVGTLVTVEELETVQAALLRVRCVGGRRFALGATEAGPFGVWFGEVNYLPDDLPVPIPSALQHMANQLGRGIAQAQADRLLDQLPLQAPYRLDECGWVANRWAELLPLTVDEKLTLLAEVDPQVRLAEVAQYMGAGTGTAAGD